MKFLYYFAIIFFSLTFNSCSNEKNQDSKLIENEYTAIVLSLCDEIGDFKFKANDTQYFDLNKEKPLDTFVFITEVACGFAGGSCGASIEVYKKTDDGYSMAYHRCGFNAKTSDDSNFGISSFTLEVRTYGSFAEPYSKPFKISWDGQHFNEIQIQKRSQL